MRHLAPRHPTFIAVVFALLAPPATSAAAAQSDARQVAQAEDLFREGVRLMEEGRCETRPSPEACERARDLFDRAFRLHPEGLGALRNRAYVEKALGRVRAARDSFRELEARAKEHPNPERRAWAAFARAEQQALAPAVPRLTIELPPSPPPDTVVRLDGAPVTPARWRTPMDAEVGSHELLVEVGGRRVFGSRFVLAARETRTVLVALDGDRAASAGGGARAGAGGAPGPGAADPASTAPEDRPGSARLGPRLLLLAGAALVAGGLAFGYAAIRKHDQVCDADNVCEPAGLESGRALARTSNVVTGAGLAVAAGGLLWALLPARPAAPTPAPRASTATRAAGWSVALGGRF